MEVVRSALSFLPRTAIVAATGSYSYLDLLAASLGACRQLEGATAPSPAASASSGPAAAAAAAGPAVAAASGPGRRVALFCDPGPDYVAGQYATWLHRGISVPLCLSHPDRRGELQYVLEDAGVSAVLASEPHAERLHRLAQPFGAAVHVMEAQQQQRAQPEAAAVRQAVLQRLEGQGVDEGAIIVYTSGTTGRPKGALHTHRSLAAMVDTLCEAWEWRQEDRILHTLPLHHVHGIVNALLCPLRVGACAEMLSRFEPAEVWRRLQRTQDPVSVFMGVPTMYAKLLAAQDHLAPDQQAQAAAAARRLRLTVSGSAACPEPTMQRWERLSGEKLLERYGMTETGMILGNPYRGERRPGTVGQPFPGVEVSICSEGSNEDASTSGPGELRVRGPQLFREYWGRPEATAEAFDANGFFLTGDTAVLQGGYYKLLGRTSVDVIKRSGYKISALHIESALLEHPAIAEAAVLGLPDEEYGETIAAVVALKPRPHQAQQPGSAPLAGGASASSSSSGGSSSSSGSGSLSLEELRGWARERLPPYQLPETLQVVEAIPRNAMGKVNKKRLREQLFPDRLPAAKAA